MFSHDSPGFLTQMLRSEAPLQMEAATSLRAHLLLQSHSKTLGGHFGEGYMYERIQMGILLATPVQGGVHGRETFREHQRLLQPIPASGPLEFVAMDIFGPPTETLAES